MQLTLICPCGRTMAWVCALPADNTYHLYSCTDTAHCRRIAVADTLKVGAAVYRFEKRAETDGIIADPPAHTIIDLR